jgi:SagB-type dehydrogenase family enzyme
LRAPGKKRGLKSGGPKAGPKAAAPVIAARLNERVTLEAEADGSVAACFDGFRVELGKFSPGAVKRAQGLRAGLAISSFTPARSRLDKEIALLVRRLARGGLLEYRLAPPRSGRDLIVIEPQMADYWPEVAKLNATDTVVLSRFAYLRRRGNDMVLESPRSSALFRICDPKVAATIAMLSTPHRIGKLRREQGSAGFALIGLLLTCDILFKVDAGSDGMRLAEGDAGLVVWDFHDLLFHTHSTEGRHANPTGGRYPYIDLIPPPPALRAPWSGNAIDLQPFTAGSGEKLSPFATLLRERHSTRDFDHTQPITLAELARFLDHAARVQWKWTSPLDFGDGSMGLEIDYTRRPYPSAGSAYELELYLLVGNCAGLDRGTYHYDADRHALVPIETRAQEIEAQLASAQFAMDAPAPPQILITIAARFDRVAWKYSGIAYALILKDVGVLLQTLYLTATDLGLGGCAIGTTNVDLFARITGQEFFREGAVGQFALGRAAKVGDSA